MYLVTAYRARALKPDDDLEKLSSYVVGVYSTPTLACESAVAEEYWRGGKYTCVISNVCVDVTDEEKSEYAKECLPGHLYTHEVQSKVYQMVVEKLSETQKTS